MTNGVVARDGGNHAVAAGFEGFRFSVAGAHTVGGVCANVVGGVGSQAGDAAGEGACAAAVGSVVASDASDSRVGSSAPAYASGSDCRAIVGGDVAADSDGGGLDIGDLGGGDRWRTRRSNSVDNEPEATVIH